MLRSTSYFPLKTLQIKSQNVTILMNVTGQYFPVALDLRLRKFPENSENQKNTSKDPLILQFFFSRVTAILQLYGNSPLYIPSPLVSKAT